MNRTYICFCLLAVSLASAFGQEQAQPMRLRLRGRRGHSARAAQDPTGGPAWSTDYELTPDTGLFSHSAVWDPATSVMIVFGGIDAGAEETDTNAVLLYTPAAASWTTLIANGAPGGPSARDSHTAVYDAANNRMIVFGGLEFSPGIETFFNDVWVLSDANGQGSPVWTQLNPTGTPPAPRCNQTAVYDAANNRMTVFGGLGLNGEQLFSDVWVLTHANGIGGTPAWIQLTPAGSLTADVELSSAVYDPVNNIMTLFGGANLAENASTNGVWTLSHANGLGGRPRWTNIVAPGAAGSPARRYGHTAVYDAANNRMIVFGGAPAPDPDDIGFNDVWVLTYANGLGGTPAWTKLKPSGTPPATRWQHTAVYDAVNNRMLAFAGDLSDPQYYLAWILSDANGL
jgi:galactose oxidase-like protein/Kelch motif protein